MSGSSNDDFSDIGATRTHAPQISQATKSLRLVVTTDRHVFMKPLPSEGRLVIGRSPQTDVPIEDHTVSRRHAVLHLGPTLMIEDLGSRNGTRVGGIPLAESELVPVGTGDLIELGSVTISVQHSRGSHADSSLLEETGAIENHATRTLKGRAGFVAGAWLTRYWPMLSRIAGGNISVLLRGETGVGKEILAELIHSHSRRAAKSLVCLNCAALPANMIESELFGHEKGAFTGAHAAKPGLLETADGGTLFLDEIGELPAPLQAKLLRAIEDGSFRRVGSNRSRQVDVRFISATHVDIESAIKEGSFRSDLYYRLNAFTIVIPPLRQRTDEIEDLATSLLEKSASADGRSAPPLSPAALSVLQGYDWPGNIRELRNVLERAFLLCDGPLVEPAHLPPEIQTRPDPSTEVVQRDSDSSEDAPVDPALLADPERRRIVEALRQCGGNQTRAAEVLGVSRRTLSSRLSKYRIPRPRGGS